MILISFFIFVVLTYFSCTPKLQNAVVLSNISDSTDFKELETYAWLPPNASMEERIILSVEDELHKRGYALNVADPDFLVMVHVLNNETPDGPVSSSLYDAYEYLGPDFHAGPFQSYYYGNVLKVPIASGEITQVDYVAGTIIVDFIDPKKNEVVWSGSAYDERNSVMDVLNDLPSYIALIFNELPE